MASNDKLELHVGKKAQVNHKPHATEYDEITAQSRYMIHEVINTTHKATWF